MRAGWPKPAAHQPSPTPHWRRCWTSGIWAWAAPRRTPHRITPVRGTRHADSVNSPRPTTPTPKRSSQHRQASVSEAARSRAASSRFCACRRRSRRSRDALDVDDGSDDLDDDQYYADAFDGRSGDRRSLHRPIRATGGSGQVADTAAARTTSHLSRKEGFQARAEAPKRNQPELLTVRALGRLGRDARGEYDEQRSIWHANLPAIETSQLVELREEIADHRGQQPAGRR